MSKCVMMNQELYEYLRAMRRSSDSQSALTNDDATSHSASQLISRLYDFMAQSRLLCLCRYIAYVYSRFPEDKSNKTLVQRLPRPP